MYVFINTSYANFDATNFPAWTAVLTVWVTLIILNLILVSSPNCWAILGTSFAESIMPNPNSVFVCHVSSPKNSSVVCRKAVKHRAKICLHQLLNPSEYPLGIENIYRLPIAIWQSNIPPLLMFAKKSFTTQYAKAIIVNIPRSPENPPILFKTTSAIVPRSTDWFAPTNEAIKSRATPRNCVCESQPSFCSTSAVPKMGNTYSIPPFSELWIGTKILPETSCRIVRCCLKIFFKDFRVYLKTVNMPKQRVFSACCAPFSLAIHKVFLRKNGFIRRKIPRCWSYFRFSDRP